MYICKGFYKGCCKGCNKSYKGSCKGLGFKGLGIRVKGFLSMGG